MPYAYLECEITRRDGRLAWVFHPDLSETLSDMVRDLAPADELVIVTDVLGGSVNTEASQFAGARGVTVVTGMNLGFVLSLVLGDAPTTAQLVDECLEGARAQLLRIEPAASEDEEF